jgi:hypothetical protein
MITMMNVASSKHQILKISNKLNYPNLLQIKNIIKSQMAWILKAHVKIKVVGHLKRMFGSTKVTELLILQNILLEMFALNAIKRWIAKVLQTLAIKMQKFR